MRSSANIDVVFARIEHYSGQTFRQIKGGEFKYRVESDYVVPDRTNQRIAKSQFAKALEFLPLTDTVPLQHLRGPSYIFAILMDDRIRSGQW
jgi:hypothetical protein